MFKNSKVGDKVFVVDTRTRIHDGYYLTITKKGRKWITLNHDSRIDINERYIDDGQYTGYERVYLSEKDWQDELAAEAAWNELKTKVENHYTLPPTTSADKIKEALKLLGL